MPTSIDLFCGAGGLSYGLSRAGFEIRLGSDNWKTATDTFSANFPSVPILDADARELTPHDLLAKADLKDPPDLIAGGPPCQGFSSAGAKRGSDIRNTLVSVYARLAVEIRPRAVIFENVEGFLTAYNGRFVIGLLDPLIEAGYRVSVQKINVANCGVPQLRKRVVAIGVLGGDPPALRPTHHAWGAPGAHRATDCEAALQTPTVEQALLGLPPPTTGAAGKPTDHIAPRLSGDDKRRIAALRPGQTMRNLPEELWHPSYRRRAYRRVCDGTPTDRRGGAPAGLRRLRGDEPSRAITSAATREFVHPIEDRPLTLREAARLQTFPDSFVFLGSRSDRALLVGNAVPPLFAEHVGAVVRTHIDATRASEPHAGALVRFNVTVSDGMSPALSGVLSLVRDRYLDGRNLKLWG